MAADTLGSAAAALRAGTTSSVALVEHALSRAEARAELNAVAHLDAEGALALAAERDRQLAAGEAVGPLHGLPHFFFRKIESPKFVTDLRDCINASVAPTELLGVICQAL